ncbi:TonB-dependent receptor family protein [Methylocella sp.]|uniref:TonB-dependent receptor family protein n=1 Tax=Methylocella sp. TaxID=1978226 RepID=UPI0035AE0CCE
MRRNLPFYREGVTLSFIALCACPAFAQDAVQNDDLFLPEVTVENAGAPQNAALTSPSVEAQREAVYSTVGSVGFVNSESFATSYSNNIADTLKDAPGVFAQTRYGQEIRLSIRGSGVARAYHARGVEILQDGLPLNFADGSGDYYQIDPLALRSIEVFKGANALIFGSSTLGGAINFVTPTAFTAIAPNVARVEGGSFGAIRGHVEVSRIVGPFDFLVSATKSDQNGYRDHSQQDYNQFNGNFGYRMSDVAETRFYLGIFDTRQKLPGTLDLATALADPTLAAPAAISGDQARNVYAQRVANRTALKLDVGELDVDSWFFHKKLDHPIFQVLDQDGITFGVSPHWRGSFDVAGFRDDLTVGLRYFAGNNATLQFVNNNGSKGALTANGFQTAANYEAYFDNRFWVTPEVALMAGGKLHVNTRDFVNYFVQPNAYGDKAYSGFLPKLGVMWRATPTIQVYADVAQSADAPDFSDLAQSNLNGLTFVPLKQQIAWTGEIGARGAWGPFAFDLTFYRSFIWNELINYYANAALGVPASTFNANHTLHQGVELSASVEAGRDLLASGDALGVRQIFTLNDFHFVNDPVYGDNSLAVIPRYVLRTELSYRHPSGFYFKPSLDWIPSGPWADYANTLKAPGYTLLGFETGVELRNGLLVYVEARNLADVHYISDLGALADARTAASTAVFYPGDGRAVFAGMRYAF